jgi:hypothetical protein
MDKAAPIRNSSDLQLAMRDVYETTYGIHNHSHETEDDALSLVAMREVEDSTAGGLIYERFRQFDERDVGKIFKINVLQFLELPTDLVTFMLEYCMKKQAQQARIVNDVEQEVAKMTGEDE